MAEEILCDMDEFGVWSRRGHKPRDIPRYRVFLWNPRTNLPSEEVDVDARSVNEATEIVQAIIARGAYLLPHLQIHRVEGPIQPVARFYRGR